MSHLRVTARPFVCLIPAVVVVGALLFAAERASSGDILPKSPQQLRRGDWNQIRALYERHRRSAVAVADEYRARNPRQQWLVRFDGRGFLLEPDGAEWKWGLELKEYGLAGAQRAIEGRARVTAEGERVRYTRADGLEEWFVNDAPGFEHGFTLKRRPKGMGDEVHLTLAVRGELRAEGSGAALRFVDSGGRSALNYSGLKAWDAEGRVLAARMESEAGGLVRLTVQDRGARYPVTIDPVAQQAYLKASNPDVADSFGASVAVSGDTVVVGAYGESSNATGVNGDQTDNSTERSGAVYVFVRNAGVWSQQAYLKASNSGALDEFGGSVAVSGDTIVVGAKGERSNATGVNGDETNDDAPDSGAAYVFVRNAGTWSQQAYLKASNTEAIEFVGDQFGYPVAVSGDTIVVGALNEDSNATGVNGNQADNSARDSGAAYVFVRSAGTWSQQAYLKASDTQAFTGFGQSSVSGDTVVVAAKAAYVFVRSAGMWTQQAYLPSVGSVAVSGDTIVVGTPAPSVLVYVRNAGVWIQQAELKIFARTFAESAVSAALSGDTVVAGIPGESSTATGVNGNQADASASRSGAAYVFTRKAGIWTEQAYLKASNTGAFDHFANSVAVSGDTIVVGAHFEDSDGTGVNGNQDNNNARDSGAAYVFRLSPPFCTLGVSLSYESGTLTNNWTAGTPVPATFTAILIGSFGKVPLWQAALPVIDPPTLFPNAFPLPPSGYVGMLGLITSSSTVQPSTVLCKALEIVNTGGAGVSANDVLRVADRIIQDAKAGEPLPSPRP